MQGSKFWACESSEISKRSKFWNLKAFKILKFENFKNVLASSSYYQIFISCFQVDIDLISKIFKKKQTAHFPGRVFSKSVPMFIILRFPKWRDLQKKICWGNVPIFSWFLLGILMSRKIKIICFGAWGPVPKTRNHRNEEFQVPQ